MKSAFLLLGLLAQLAFAGFAFIWILAFLGFVDETKRSVSTTLFGKLLVTFCVGLAATPILITFWVGWCLYFSAGCWSRLPVGFFLPLVCILSSLAVCVGLIYLFKLAGYRREQ